MSKNAQKANYQKETTDVSESQFDMLKKLELDVEAHKELITYCKEKDIIFLSTPFDHESIDLLSDLGLQIFKIPSGEITNLFKRHMNNICPTTSKILVIEHHGGEPVVVETNTLGYKAASLAFKEIWGKEPIPTYDGGSIPIVSLFKSELGLDSILMGFGLDEDAIHSPNESFGLYNFYKGIETIAIFYRNFSQTNE